MIHLLDDILLDLVGLGVDATGLLESISPTFWEQLLSTQIPKD